MPSAVQIADAALPALPTLAPGNDRTPAPAVAATQPGRAATQVPDDDVPTVGAVSAAAPIPAAYSSLADPRRPWRAHQAPGLPTAFLSPAPMSLNFAVTGVLDAVSNWLSSLPANPVSEFVNGALLLVRRAVFNQVPTADTEQNYVGEPPDFDVVGTIDATDPEGDPLTYTLTGEPTFGLVSIDSNGNFIYTPNDLAQFGTDEFTVEVSDGGFNLLDPLSGRSTSVTVTVGRAPLVGYSQGFDIINLTNEVLWLTKVGVNDQTGGYPVDWINDACGKGFCLDTMVGRSLQPGEAIPFQAKTDSDIYVYLMFSSNTGNNWGVRVLPRYKNSESIIDSFYADESIGPYPSNPGADGSKIPYGWVFPDRPNWASPVGSTPGGTVTVQARGLTTSKTVVDWNPIKSGTWSSTQLDLLTRLQPIAYSTQNGNRLFLTSGSGQDHTITSGSTWATNPPDWCGYCKPVTVTPQSVLNNFLKASPGPAPDGTSYGENDTSPYTSDFIPTYKNLVLEKFGNQLASSDSTGSRIEVINNSGNEGVTVSRSGTVELNPGPGTEKDPNAPWWQNPASQAAGGLASFLLGKIPFVPESIASAIGGAIGGAIAPGDVPKRITATTTTATITPLPHSFSVLTTSNSINRYLVNGDVSYTIPMRGAESTTFSFTKMDFVVNDPTSVKDGQTLNALFRTVPYQETGATNVGFRLSDKASWNTGLGVPEINPTYRADPAVAHLLGMELYLGAAANARGEDATGQACGGERTVNCATFTVQSSNPSVVVAEVKVLPSNQAVLIATAPGTATVIAQWNWQVEVGGVVQSLTGTAKASMGVTVTA